MEGVFGYDGSWVSGSKMSWKNPLRVGYLEIINRIDDFNQEIPQAKDLTKKDLMYVITDMEVLLDDLKDLYEET